MRTHADILAVLCAFLLGLTALTGDDYLFNYIRKFRPR